MDMRVWFLLGAVLVFFMQRGFAMVETGFTRAKNAATFVSSAMAERTKFSTYCIYSALISAVIYPIEAGWVWNSAGWHRRAASTSPVLS